MVSAARRVSLYSTYGARSSEATGVSASYSRYKYGSLHVEIRCLEQRPWKFSLFVDRRRNGTASTQQARVSSHRVCEPASVRQSTGVSRGKIRYKHSSNFLSPPAHSEHFLRSLLTYLVAWHGFQ